MKWSIIAIILAVGLVVVIIYYITFNLRPTVVKKKAKLDGILLSIDKKESSWILFSNTHLEYKKDKWILFDNMIMTDSCLYLINYLANVGSIVETDWKKEKWELKNKGDSKFIKNPILVYKDQIKKFLRILDFKFETQIILVVDNESFINTDEDVFIIKEFDLDKLHDKIKNFEITKSFETPISQEDKRKFLIKIQNYVYDINKKNILKGNEEYLPNNKKKGFRK
ncbi:hypothetical protein [Spiroplasma endosymbiont of Aspidapion aeneum]|uniref:hypothetical protein n=1 Tax=Spiroplasma endosymbiont of Aspidapion aeneum TaxID=3066276 RepID=UPI00313BD8E2